MRFSVDSRSAGILKLLACGVSPKDAVGRYVKIRAEEHRVAFAVFNGSVGARVFLETDVEEQGEITTSYTEFVNVISTMSSGFVTVYDGDGKVHIAGENSISSISSIYDEIVKEILIPANAPRVHILSDDFRKIVKRVSFAAAQDDARVLNVVRLEFATDKVVAVAADGYRIAIDEAGCSGGAAFTAHVNARDLAKIVSSLGHGNVVVVNDDNFLHITYGNACFSVVKTECNYVNYRPLVDGILALKDEAARALVNPKALLWAVKRASSVAAGEIKAVRVTIGDGITVESHGDSGNYVERIVCDTSGDATAVINSKYLSSVLEKIGDVAIFYIRDARSPVHISDGGVYFYAVMPIYRD